MTVSLEDYTIKEDARNNGFDTMVEITLKQFKDFKTEVFNVVTPTPTAPIALEPARSDSTAATGGNRGGGSGGGGKKKKYKVQIPGMGAVEVWATSVQDAITKAGAGSWTGTIYVDGVSYYVKNGIISVDPATITRSAAKGAVTGAVTAAVAAIVKPAATTTASIVGATAAASVTNAIKKKN